MISVVAASKTYRQGRRIIQAVRSITMTVESGEFVTIMGPSGSGKSTLMHLIGALDTPSTGQVLFEKHDIAKLSDKQRSILRRDRIGFVFQAFNLLPTLTASENVALPLLLAGMRQSEATKKAERALGRVGLAERASHFPDELSGGEVQRTAVARAIVGEPACILCDEPTGNLDTTSSREVLKLLQSLPEVGRRAVVMVTHDPTAAEFGTRIVRVRDGLVEADELVGAS